MKKRIKTVLIMISIILLLFVIYKCLISGYSTPLFGKKSIVGYTSVELGGVKQKILIRGENINNPVLLYIHGGPGNPETSFIVPYQKEWEKYYTVVNWDQRGTGKSYHKDIDVSTLNTKQICSDTKQLTDFLKKRFGQEKIFIVGHSYGTYIASLCVRNNPEDYYAYIGTGQIGNQQENELALIDYAVTMSEKDGNEKAVSELRNLPKMPYSKENFGRAISTSRKWTTYYGGAIWGQKNTNGLYLRACFNPEYNLEDYINFFKGEALYYTNTSQDVARWELFHANLIEEVPKLDVPVYFIQGKNDYITSYSMCERYFDELIAPEKYLFPIEECAHNVISEKTEAFDDILINVVRKHAGSVE